MKNKIICAIFILLIFGFTLFDLFTPDREFSEWENRTLTQAPTLTLKTLASGEFGKQYESYITDQFVLRDTFVKAKFLSDMALGKRDSGGVYVTDNSLYSVQPDPEYKIIDKNMGAMASFAERTGLSSYLTVVPSSTYIYRDSLPPFAPVIDEKEIFYYIGKNIKGVNFVDVTDKMHESRANYNYFRTDHHWTADGALIGYNAFLNALGKESLTKDSFSVIQISDDFVGTLSSKSGALGIEKDILQRFDRGNVLDVEIWNGVESNSYESIYFDEYLDKKDKYSYYLGTNQPIVRIKTDAQGGRLLAFKDSYAHIMTPMMLGDWSEIVLVDLRYVRERIDVLLERVTGLKPSEFDVALFLYSTETFTTQDNMIWIK
ncbi:MAG: hypothetical protein IKL05_03840 [Clostridia bacterium]|nr:hypothetical protein [Clostridia bacterium]